MTGIHRRGALLAAPALIGVLSGRAHAQAWPARQVRIVVGFAAGGANDGNIEGTGHDKARGNKPSTV